MEDIVVRRDSCVASQGVEQRSTKIYEDVLLLADPFVGQLNKRRSRRMEEGVRARGGLKKPEVLAR